MSAEPMADSISRRRIWIVAPSSPPYGGMSVQAERLFRKLLSEGIHAEFIPTNPIPPRIIVALGKIAIVRTILREIQYLASLGRILRNPGVVHHFSASYLFFFLHSAPLLLLARICSFKIILNYRGGKAPIFFRTWSWLVVPLIRKASDIAVPSNFLLQLFRQYGMTATLLPNLADTDSFGFKARNPLRPRFFVTRNLEPMYDVESVLRAFRLIQQRIPEATLGIAGAGSEEARLRALAAEWNLHGVEFYGAVPWNELPAIYEDFDIYLNASRVDNFPGALVEAACSGLPIITTRAGGIPEMIRDRDNGLLVDIGDANALAQASLELLDCPELALRLTRNAREWAEKFSWRRVFPELLLRYGMTIPCASPIREEHVLVVESKVSVKLAE
jgi:glycosyltransferase involved in cell wall biosynthesis